MCLKATRRNVNPPSVKTGAHTSFKHTRIRQDMEANPPPTIDKPDPEVGANIAALADALKRHYDAPALRAAAKRFAVAAIEDFAGEALDKALEVARALAELANELDQT